MPPDYHDRFIGATPVERKRIPIGDGSGASVSMAAGLYRPSLDLTKRSDRSW